MTPEQWEIISRVFNEATALKADERDRFIEEACHGDKTLIAEVESLLFAHDEAGDFIENPIVEGLAVDVSEMPTLTGKLIGHYRIEKSIGRGGMGDVYLATDTRLDRRVALKRLPRRLAADPQFVKRFRTEAKAAATLHHTNVATIFSVEDSEDGPFITMEYVEGRTLEAVTPPEGMDIETFLDVFIQVSEALRHAHEKGVTHRDIKPGNIMIGADGTTKILDFGLAQIAEDNQSAELRSSTITQPGQILGTPSYMSPEQAQGKNVDHRTDIFSLGIVMYEAITGKRPFIGDNNAELVSNLLKSDPAQASEIRSTVPGLLSRLIARCMQKRRSERPQSMQEIRTLLGESRRIVRAGTSTGSFARRLYIESTSAALWLRMIPVGLVVVLATIAWLYFSSADNGPQISFEKMTMRRLSDTNNVGYAQIAPDGRSVAFATFEDDGTRALWMRRVDDRNALQIVPPQRVQYWGGLAISEDGGQVFYITAGRTANYGTLYRVSSLGGPSRKLVDTANDVGGISPDGQRILFVRYGEPSQIISANTSDGGDERVIFSAPDDDPPTTNFRDPQFSPDGRFIYFIRNVRIRGVEKWSVESVAIDGSEAPKVIYEQPDRISEIAVLRDAGGLLTTAIDPISNLQQLFHLSLTDGKKTRVTNDIFFYFGVSVDRDGKNILISQRADQQRLWIGSSADLSSLKPLIQEPNLYRYVDWTPDGRLVYDGYENNVAHIWIADADGRNLQKLTASGADDFGPRVSGDGRFIVFTSKRSGRYQVWRMNIDGSDQVLLADVPGVTQLPKFAADGQTVVFEWGLDRERILARVPVTGGSVEEVARLDSIPSTNTFYWAMSPDGTTVAYSTWDESDRKMKIAVRPVHADQPSAVLDIWPSLVFKWTPDSKMLFYREREAGYQPENEIMQVDPATGRSKRLLSAGPEYVADLTYSRDGKKVAVIRGHNQSNAVLLSAIPESQSSR